MILSYFDENKFSEDRPLFYIGGVMVPDAKITQVEDSLSIIVRNFFGISLLTKETEIHGKELWHGKDYTRSHHSRFLQLADLIVFLAQRFEREESSPEKWIESHGWNFWQSLRTETDCQVKRWP